MKKLLTILLLTGVAFLLSPAPSALADMQACGGEVIIHSYSSGSSGNPVDGPIDDAEDLLDRSRGNRFCDASGGTDPEKEAMGLSVMDNLGDYHAENDSLWDRLLAIFGLGSGYSYGPPEL